MLLDKTFGLLLSICFKLILAELITIILGCSGTDCGTFYGRGVDLHWRIFWEGHFSIHRRGEG